MRKVFIATVLLLVIGLQCVQAQRQGAGFNNGHEYVVIGGLKWATMNVGATTVAGDYATCQGDYFAWGETQPRYAKMSLNTTIGEFTFIWQDGFSNGYTYENFPHYVGKKLDAAHDAATAAWGGTWRTPTHKDFKSLVKACSGSSKEGYMYKSLNSAVTTGGIYWLDAGQTYEPAYTGMAGLLFVSARDISKRVFFPACGFVNGAALYEFGRRGAYWSSSILNGKSYDAKDYAYCLKFYSSYVYHSSFSQRYCAFPVRPVSD